MVSMDPVLDAERPSPQLSSNGDLCHGSQGPPGWSPEFSICFVHFQTHVVLE
jgi:hypothetical protein